MPNYNPNYVYSPRYGSRYMGNRIPSPATGGAGQQDPMSAPINYEAGAQAQSPVAVGQAVDGGQGVAPTNAPLVMDTSMGAVGWTGGTGRDTSAISNLGDFGFRGLATGDPFDEGYFQSPTTPETVPSPVTGSPEVPQIGSSSGDSTIPKASWSIVDNDPLSSGYQFIGGPSNFTPGNFNIAGSSENGGLDFEGNRKGYYNPRTAIGYNLGQYADMPILPGALIAGVASNMLLDHGTTNIPGVGNVGTTAGSFDAGAFSGGDGSPTDISGGATGSNVAVNQFGDKVSLGYGYGQVDPAIARAAGFSVGVPIEDRSTAFDKSIADIDMSNMSADEIAAAMQGSEVANLDPALMTAEARFDMNRMQEQYMQQDQKEYQQVASQMNSLGINVGDKDRKTLQSELPQAQAAAAKAKEFGINFGANTDLDTAQAAVKAAEAAYVANLAQFKALGVSAPTKSQLANMSADDAKRTATAAYNDKKAKEAQASSDSYNRSTYSTLNSGGNSYNWGSASSSSRESSALGGGGSGSGVTSSVGSRGGNASRGFSSGGWNTGGLITPLGNPYKSEEAAKWEEEFDNSLEQNRPNHTGGK